MTFSEYFDNLSLKGRIVATLEYKQLYSSNNINMIFYELYVTLVNDMNCINALTYLHSNLIHTSVLGSRGTY